MQEVLSETHSVLKNILQEGEGLPNMQKSRLVILQYYSQLFYIIFHILCQDSECQTSNSKQIRKNMPGCSEEVAETDSISTVSNNSQVENGFASESVDRIWTLSPDTESATSNSYVKNNPESYESSSLYAHTSLSEVRDDSSLTSGRGSSWDQLRKDAIEFVSQTLKRGRKNLWQLTTSRISMFLSSSAVCSTSVHQFLKNYEDLNVFILAGETFCGVEAVDFRQRLKTVCENYFAAFHRQNIYVCQLI
ncbi:hypothetical protein IFM89_036381 [Coptis chinensis]|uniref:Uncharacterized protein n=1 Tax=Coptis chinensis TaxID=261450 RepID=A0A835HBD2_9MAGN|nr:hypothetical protein IFM89_036381 [Coptis chinensis]